MAVFISSAKIVILTGLVCLLNDVAWSSFLPSSSIRRSTKSCEDDKETQEYAFRFASTGSTNESGIRGSVLLTVDKKNLCAEITTCEAKLKSNEVLSDVITVMKKYFFI